MKPQDCGPQYSSRLRECANFAVWTIKKICKDIGPRPSGSEEEFKAEEFIAKQVGSAADKVETQEFTIARKAFFAWMRIDAVLLTIATFFLLFKMPIVSLILAVVAFICLAGEFLFYREFLDGLFAKQTSHNTILTRNPTGEVKRRIIFAGHVDSSYEWRYTHIGGAPLMYFSFIYAAIGLGWNTVFSIVAMATDGIFTPSTSNIEWYGWVALVFIPAYVMLFFFINYNICVDGANDNLSGALCCAAVLKFMEDNNIRFENTEVISLLTGSEEAGLRGAKTYAKEYGDKCKEIETMFVALDTFTDYEDMAIYNKDMSGLTKHDPKCCNLMKKAAENAGLDLKFSVIFAGASDAAAATQAGIPSTSLAAMNPGPPKYYHTKDDKVDILSLKTIEKCIEIAVEAACIFDEKGLCDNY